MKRINNVLCLFLSVILIFGLCACFDMEMKVYIFENIEECQNINTYKSDDAVIEMYDSPAGDKYLKDLQYNDFFACKYSSESFNFEIFAYEFLDSDTSKEYFENVADRKSERESDFLTWGGILNYSRVVIDGRNAYIIHSKTSSQEKINEFISTVFSVELYN